MQVVIADFSNRDDSADSALNQAVRNIFEFIRKIDENFISLSFGFALKSKHDCAVKIRILKIFCLNDQTNILVGKCFAVLGLCIKITHFLRFVQDSVPCFFSYAVFSVYSERNSVDGNVKFFCNFFHSYALFHFNHLDFISFPWL